MASFFNRANQARLGALGASLLAASGRLPQNVSRASLMGKGFQQAMEAGREAEKYETDLARQKIIDARATAQEDRAAAQERRRVAEAERLRMQRELGQELFGGAPSVTGGPVTTSLGMRGRAATLAEIGGVYPEAVAEARIRELTTAPKIPSSKEVYDKTLQRYVFRTPSQINANPDRYGKPVAAPKTPDMKLVYRLADKRFTYVGNKELAENPHLYGKAPSKSTISARQLELITKKTASDRNQIKSGAAGYFDIHDQKELDLLLRTNPIDILMRELSDNRTTSPITIKDYSELGTAERARLFDLLTQNPPNQTYTFENQEGMWTFRDGKFHPYPPG